MGPVHGRRSAPARCAPLPIPRKLLRQPAAPASNRRKILHKISFQQIPLQNKKFSNCSQPKNIFFPPNHNQSRNLSMQKQILFFSKALKTFPRQPFIHGVKTKKNSRFKTKKTPPFQQRLLKNHTSQSQKIPSLTAQKSRKTKKRRHSA